MIKGLRVMIRYIIKCFLKGFCSYHLLLSSWTFEQSITTTQTTTTTISKISLCTRINIPFCLHTLKTSMKKNTKINNTMNKSEALNSNWVKQERRTNGHMGRLLSRQPFLSLGFIYVRVCMRVSVCVFVFMCIYWTSIMEQSNLIERTPDWWSIDPMSHRF